MFSGEHSEAYIFRIYDDGFVEYYGYFKVNVLGAHYANISPEQVQQLVAIYESLDKFIKKLHSINRNVSSHPPSELFELWRQGEKSKLFPGGFADYMYIRLNTMIPFENWVCLPKNNPLRQDIGCPLGRPYDPTLDVEKKISEELIRLERMEQKNNQ